MAHVNFTGMWQDTRLCSEGILCVAELQHIAPPPPPPKYRWKCGLVESAGLEKVREGYAPAEAIKKGWQSYKSCRKIV